MVYRIPRGIFHSRPILARDEGTAAATREALPIIGGRCLVVTVVVRSTEISEWRDVVGRLRGEERLSGQWLSGRCCLQRLVYRIRAGWSIDRECLGDLRSRLVVTIALLLFSEGVE